MCDCLQSNSFTSSILHPRSHIFLRALRVSVVNFLFIFLLEDLCIVITRWRSQAHRGRDTMAGVNRRLPYGILVVPGNL